MYCVQWFRSICGPLVKAEVKHKWEAKLLNAFQSLGHLHMFNSCTCIGLVCMLPDYMSS